jgi:hypothetical protein
MKPMTPRVVILGLLAVSTGAGAQALPTLKPGVPVRLVVRTVAGPRSFAGALLLLDLDSVTIVPRQAVYPVAFPLRSLDRFEVNRGQPRALLYGAPIYGAALGTLFGATALRPDARCRVLPNDEGCRWETSEIVVGAAGGAVLFGIIVRLVVPDVWRQIPVRALVVDHDAGGFRLGLRAAVPPRPPQGQRDP